MRLIISLEEILVTGTVLCAILLAIGITFGHVNVVEGGAIITSLCGGTVIAKVLRLLRHGKKERHHRTT